MPCVTTLIAPTYPYTAAQGVNVYWINECFAQLSSTSRPYHGSSLFCWFPRRVWDLSRAIILPGPAPGDPTFCPRSLEDGISFGGGDKRRV